MHTLPDATLSALSELLTEKMGFDFPRERWGDLERGMLAAAHDFGGEGLESCARQVLAGPLTHRHIEILASHLTVGETYFYRDRASFDALEQNVLPTLIQTRRESGRSLRIWSAGCCTGEEPYSIAILLDRLLPADEHWHITLLATDINPMFLRKAMAGTYGEWSFRQTPSWIRDRYFRKVGHGRYELHPRIRKRVTFSYLNLAEDIYPSLTNNTNAMDLILCRNVLMYFTEARRHTVIGNLYRALVDGGSLNVSPSEASGKLFAEFAPAILGDATFYRKVGRDRVRVAEPEFQDRSYLNPSLPTDIGVAREMSALREPRPAMEPLSQASCMDDADGETVAPASGTGPGAEDDAEQLYTEAERRANEGRLTEAAALCGRAIARDKLNPKSHYLLATIWRELGRDDEAEACLKRTLYLAPDFLLASFAFGNLRLSQGRHEESERHFRNALTLLQRRAPLECVSEGDGLLAGRLSEIITSVLDSLPHTDEPGKHTGK